MLGNANFSQVSDNSKSHFSSDTTNDDLAKVSFYKRFKCGFCGLAFQSEELFVTHLRKYYRERKRKREAFPVTDHDIKLERHKLQGPTPFKPELLNYSKIHEQVAKAIRNEPPAALTGTKLIKEENVELDSKGIFHIKSEIEDPTRTGIKFEQIAPSFSMTKVKPTPAPTSPVKQEPKDEPCNYTYNGPLAGDLEQRFFDCSECCFRGKTSEALADHMTALHSRKIFHLIREKEKVYYDCSQCCFRAPDNKALQNHIRVLHKTPDSRKQSVDRSRFLDCSFCCFRAQNKEALSRHMSFLHQTPTDHLSSNSRTMPQFLDCSQCCFRAQDAAALSKHTQAIHPLSEVKHTANCDKCGFRAGSAAQLAAHKRDSHLILRLLQCSRCSFASSSQDQLDRHVISQHSDTEGTG